MNLQALASLDVHAQRIQNEMEKVSFAAGDEKWNRVLWAKVEELQQQMEEFDKEWSRVLTQGQQVAKVLDKEVGKDEGLKVTEQGLLEIKHRFSALQACLRRELKRLTAHLPILARRSHLVQAVENSQVVVVKAETGSGKSTQIVQYLADAGFGRIVCSQPRKLAARALATRIAEEWGCPGETTKIGFFGGYGRSDVGQLVRLATHSVMLNELARDPLLSAYDVVVLDEVHERGIEVDLLLGLLKRCLRRRPALKIIVMSATLDQDLFQRFFAEFNCHELEISGRTFPIEYSYLDQDPDDYVKEAVRYALQFHESDETGHILVFLAGQDEVERAEAMANQDLERRQGKQSHPRAQVLPLHGKLAPEESAKIFLPCDQKQTRKIIFSTNVAETSVTIDGVAFVVDTGMAKVSVFDSERKIQVLKLGFITASSAKQRAGRAGRTGPGKCLRLYAEDTFEKMPSNPPAEILCTQPTKAVLKLLSLGVSHRELASFDWLEAPSVSSLNDAVTTLKLLRACDPASGILNERGKCMAVLPTTPQMSSMLLVANEADCLEEALILAGMLSVAQMVFWRSKDQEQKEIGQKSRLNFSHSTGDHLTLLQVYRLWQEQQESPQWCRRHHINSKAMNTAKSTSAEIARAMATMPLFSKHSEVLSLWSAGKKSQASARTGGGQESRDDSKMAALSGQVHGKGSPLSSALGEKLRRCILMGFFQNLCVLNGPARAGFRVVSSNSNASIQSSSALMTVSSPPRWAIFHDLLDISGRALASTLTAVDDAWFHDLLPLEWRDRIVSVQRTLYHSHVHHGLGSALLRSVVGTKGRILAQFEKRHAAVMDVNFDLQSVTLWAANSRLEDAKKDLNRMLEEEKLKLLSEVLEVKIIGSTRAVLGAGGQTQQVLFGKEHLSIILRNLPSQTTEAHIKELCARFGKVLHVDLFSPTTASVRFERSGEAKAAFSELKEMYFNGSKLQCSPGLRREGTSSTQDSRLRLVSYLHPSKCEAYVAFSSGAHAVTAMERMQASVVDGASMKLELRCPSSFVELQWSGGSSTGQARVDFTSIEDAEAARLSVTEAQLEGSVAPFHLSIWYEKSGPRLGGPSSALFLKSLHPSVTEQDLQQIFGHLSGYKSCRVKRSGDSDLNEQKQRLDHLLRSYPSFVPGSIFFHPDSSPQDAFLPRKGKLKAYAQISREQDRMNLKKNADDGKTSLPGVKVWSAKTKLKEDQKAQHHASTFSLRVTGLSPETGEEGLLQAFQRTVSGVLSAKLLRDPTKSIAAQYDMAEMSVMIRSMLSPDCETMDLEFGQDRIEVTAHFTDALAVTEELDRLGSRFIIADLSFHASPCIKFRTSVHPAMVQAIPEKLEKVVSSMEKVQGVSVSTFRGDKGMMITIDGPRAEYVLRASSMLNDLLKGQPVALQDRNQVLFLFSREGSLALQKIQKETGCYIWWNVREGIVRLYGEEAAIQASYERIQAFLTQCCRTGTSSYRIPPGGVSLLQREEWTGFLEQLKAAHGVVLEVSLVKRSISVSGSHEARQSALGDLKQFFSQIVIGQSGKHSNDECFVCFCPATNPYKLVLCGHQACLECLSAFIEAESGNFEQGRLNVRCCVEGCAHPFTIRDLVSVATGPSLEQMSQASFRFYHLSHRQLIVDCPGNCDQVMSLAPDQPKRFACDTCNGVFCRQCRIPYHVGLTCEQWKEKERVRESEQKIMSERKTKEEAASGEALSSMKRCPSCTVPVFKISGCNAMRCGLCKVPWCYLCHRYWPDKDDAHFHFSDGSPCHGKIYEGVYDHIL